MARATIDFGVDLGTTNSEIAVLDGGRLRVFKNAHQLENTPSVVRVDRRGTVHVGQAAYAQLEADSENTVGEFKRLMGQAHEFRFVASGRAFAPEELSAEVLKSLRADALRAGYECRAAVITVPAYFEIVQCEATRRAAALAGLLEPPLLQEPIAAAIAFGRDAVPGDGYWMVYDLGGGTFDVAVIKRADGHLSIVECGGDNHLGGKDFDWLLVEGVLIPALRDSFDLPGLSRGNEAYRMLIAKLKAKAEEARIALTDQADATVYVENGGNDRSGREVELIVPVSRRELEKLVEPLIERTLKICGETLSRARLSGKAIERVILVGGPTMMPAVRAGVRNGLNVAIDITVDPITVVAQGAAMYASSQAFPYAHQERTAGRVLMRLAFNALCQQTKTRIAGKIEGAGGSPSPDLRIRLIRDDQGWQSGFVPVRNGAFSCEVSLREHQPNTFRLALFDEAGQAIPVEPDTLCITQGLSVASPPLQRTIGVEVVGEGGRGRFEPLIERGTSLPAKGTRRFRTAVALQPGSSQDVLNVHVYEGEHENPEHNRPLGTLKLSGAQVRRPIPVGQEIQVTLTVNASRVPTAQAYVPLLDESFQEVLRATVTPMPDAAELGGELARLKQSVTEVGSEAGQDSEQPLSRQLADATLELEAAQGGDPGALVKADRMIREVKATVANLVKATELPRQLEALDGIERETQRVVQQYGEPAEREQFSGLQQDARRARERQDARLCQEVARRLEELYWAVLFRQDGFWVGAFQDLAERGRFTDAGLAKSLLAEGTGLLQGHDMTKFREIVWRLWQLVPADTQRETAARVSSAGIRTV